MAKGFNRGPATGGQSGMMQQLQQMQKKMEIAQAKLAEEGDGATAGGGAFKVIMTGDQKSQSVEISPGFLKDADAEIDACANNLFRSSNLFGEAEILDNELIPLTIQFQVQ